MGEEGWRTGGVNCGGGKLVLNWRICCVATVLSVAVPSVPSNFFFTCDWIFCCYSVVSWWPRCSRELQHRQRPTGWCIGFGDPDRKWFWSWCIFDSSRGTPCETAWRGRHNQGKLTCLLRNGTICNLELRYNQRKY